MKKILLMSFVALLMSSCRYSGVAVHCPTNGDADRGDCYHGGPSSYPIQISAAQARQYTQINYHLEREPAGILASYYVRAAHGDGEAFRELGLSERELGNLRAGRNPSHAAMKKFSQRTKLSVGESYDLVQRIQLDLN